MLTAIDTSYRMLHVLVMDGMRSEAVGWRFGIGDICNTSRTAENRLNG